MAKAQKKRKKPVEKNMQNFVPLLTARRWRPTNL